ncbi:MAG TPA: glycoside hydrolase family 15 protein [Ktedonobacterales bacterium]|jgi:GH15 family glucan-1,4-alpha-glucosidase
MPRDLPVGNGRLLITFDQRYVLRDVYYPRVGHSNQTIGHPNRFGVWVAEADGADPRFAWSGDDCWERRLDYWGDTLVTDVALSSEALGLRLRCHDAVTPDDDTYLKQIEITNLAGRERLVRLFFHHDFHIEESGVGDTAYYEPYNEALLHYRGRRYFLIDMANEQRERIAQYATGTKEYGGLEGAWRDAEDGLLSGNPIAQGFVDSVAGMEMRLPAGGTVTAHYWMVAGRDFFEVRDRNRRVREVGVPALLERTRRHWRGWLKPAKARDFADLPDALIQLYRRSLLIIATQCDAGGAIIAANDGDSALSNADTYSYMWPRDGALVAHALDGAGYPAIPRAFHAFCARLIAPTTYYHGGYLLHKYHADGSLGSSWHPWVRDGRPTLPVQEDETALVLWELWGHVERYPDYPGLEQLYEQMVRPAAEFLLYYRLEDGSLPRESYDLWEERYGIYTFTTAATIAGLKAAACFARRFGDDEAAGRFAEGAAALRAGLDQHLYDAERGYFLRGVTLQPGAGARAAGEESPALCPDATLDSSVLAALSFGVLPADDPRVVSTARAIEERLWVRTEVGGIARYEGDRFRYEGRGEPEVPGNPWFICTLWLAEWYTEAAARPEDLTRARALLEWCARWRSSSGVLTEQLNPYSGRPAHVSPLTWSHAAYVHAVDGYCRRAAELAAAQAPQVAAVAEDAGV